MIRKIHEVTSGVKLIGIHGKAGVGKDTVASYISKHYPNVYGEPLARTLKDAAAIAFGIDRSIFDDPELKEEVNSYWGVSPRMIAQFVGTEMFRNVVVGLIPDSGLDFWIHRLTGKLNGDLDDGIEYDSTDTVIVTDVRFPNEATWILENSGALLHLVRTENKPVGIPDHASEAGIGDVKGNVWYIPNNSTMEVLYANVDEFCSAHGMKKKILTLDDL